MMKKIAVILALALCLMAAMPAMAETPANHKYGNYWAISGNYYIELREASEDSFGDDLNSPSPSVFKPDMLAYVKELLGTDDFKYMLYDAEAFDSQGTSMNIGTTDATVSSVTVAFDSDFFDGDLLKKICVVYRTNEGMYKYTVLNKTNGAEVTVDHLTPVMFAWVPDVVPVAAPLDVPQTGDNSQLPGLFILLGMSVAAFGAMKLRHREN